MDINISLYIHNLRISLPAMPIYKLYLSSFKKENFISNISTPVAVAASNHRKPQTIAQHSLIVLIDIHNLLLKHICTNIFF